MWWIKSDQTEDEEALLPPSPSSTTSNISEHTLPTSAARWRRIPRLLLALIWQLILFTIPSFMRRSPLTSSVVTSEKSHLQQATNTRSTEYLDGLRGLASFIVFIFHWTHIQYPGTNTGYGVSKEPSLWQLPIIRIVYSGAAMVSIFFVVSGYVLTHRFIKKMHRHEFDSLFSGLTSLTFRRAMRLFLPSLGSCLLSFICASIGWLAIPEKVDGRRFHHGFRALISYIDKESNPWTWESYMKGYYNPQLWSIALEYRGSMVAFLTVVALSRTRTSVRMLAEVAIIAHAFGHKRWDVALFIAGMLIAELDVLVHMSTSRSRLMQRKRTKLILITIMIAGLWLSGFPRDHGVESFGYTFLSKSWPYSGFRRRFWLGIASIMIVAPMPYLSSIQGFFNTRLIKYLGKISFALYLIHGLGNRTVGSWLLHTTWDLFGKEGAVAYARCYILSSMLYVPLIIWWSDMFWRGVDVPSTHFAKWVEGKCASRIAN